MTETPQTADTPRCVQCGAAAPAPPTGAEPDEPVTHCEWCGAEYPVPEQK